MDPLKLHMEVQDILKGFFPLGVVFRQQGLHFIGNFFRKGCISAADFIREFLILANSKPIFSGITGAILQNQVKFFDELLRQSCFCMINNHVNAAEVICCFDHVIHIQHFFFYADGVGFKDISGLIVCQAASFHMVGIVCQFDLCFMVDPTGTFTCLLFFQNIQQSSRFIFSFVGTLRLFCVFRNVPCLAGKKRTVHTPLGAVISNIALGHIPFFRYFSN